MFRLAQGHGSAHGVEDASVVRLVPGGADVPGEEMEHPRLDDEKKERSFIAWGVNGVYRCMGDGVSFSSVCVGFWGAGAVYRRLSCVIRVKHFTIIWHSMSALVPVDDDREEHVHEEEHRDHVDNPVEVSTWGAVEGDMGRRVSNERQRTSKRESEPNNASQSCARSILFPSSPLRHRRTKVLVLAVDVLFPVGQLPDRHHHDALERPYVCAEHWAVGSEEVPTHEREHGDGEEEEDEEVVQVFPHTFKCLRHQAEPPVETHKEKQPNDVQDDGNRVRHSVQVELFTECRKMFINIIQGVVTFTIFFCVLRGGKRARRAGGGHAERSESELEVCSPANKWSVGENGGGGGRTCDEHLGRGQGEGERRM